MHEVLIYVELRKIFVQRTNRKLFFSLISYDFRRGVDELGEFFDNFTQLVVDTYELNNQTKVVVITHSMGGWLFLFECEEFEIRIYLGPLALYWLHQQTADFKAKYIRSMINLAAPWGGATKALRLMISGDNIDVRLD